MFQPYFHRVWRLLPLVAFGATGGCFATRGDVRIVQGDIVSLRAEMLKNQQEHKDALAQTQRLIQVASDSLAKVSARTVSIQGDVRGEMRGVREQLLQIQTLLGQSQATIARLRAEMEVRNTMTPPPTAPAPSADPAPSGRSGSSRSNPPATTPPAVAVDTTSVLAGPNQLYTTGRDQLLRGATATARMTFQELITNYPQSDYASDAQFWIAESLAKENNVPAADAAYAAVVSAYPSSAKAPTALYKRAQLVLKQGNTAQARQLFEQVVARYPRSDEAELATETLKTLR
ncbi:tol-pal system protein YbgF [Gemmatimonas phototrophica]|uniref:tol-pal system protein YbgF n=1 Tax=Gemmatimonas phototrophica TaxID=1379270 RepID=UPI0006A6CAF5|nr:tol-pal system protein YbgF [Gemmatimonas phototrophica]